VLLQASHSSPDILRRAGASRTGEDGVSGTARDRSGPVGEHDTWTVVHADGAVQVAARCRKEKVLMRRRW